MGRWSPRPDPYGRGNYTNAEAARDSIQNTEPGRKDSSRTSPRLLSFSSMTQVRTYVNQEGMRGCCQVIISVNLMSTRHEQQCIHTLSTP